MTSNDTDVIPPAEPPKIEKKGRLTLDEILDSLSEMGRDPDAGADRFRALKMLKDSQEATTVLPEPMDAAEIAQRLARLMYCAGAQLTQSAYKLAFPSGRDAANLGTRDKLRYKDATPEMVLKAKRITSLPLLNRAFPEQKLNHQPKGYPQHQSQAAKAEWCQKEALKRLVEAEIGNRKDAHEELKADDSEARGMDADVHSEDLPEL